MISNEEAHALQSRIARNEPILFVEEDRIAESTTDRLKVRKGGYAYVPTLKHPLQVGEEKFQNDLFMRRLRHLPLKQRVEAAVCQNMPWCIEHLYLTGCDVDVPNKMGYRPLHYAAFYNFTECVKVLLHMKMDVEVNSTTKNLYTPYYIAISNGSHESAELIRKAGGVANALPPLSGYRSILDTRVENGASIPTVHRHSDDKVANFKRSFNFGQF